MRKIIASSDAGFDIGAWLVRNFGHAQRLRRRHNRLAPVYTGHPSWRTQLRRAWRRVQPHLPKSDEEVLVEMRLAMEFGNVDWLRRPLISLRLLKPLPDPMLAVDGKTRFRYFKVQKAACTSVVRMLVATCGRRGDFGSAREKLGTPHQQPDWDRRGDFGGAEGRRGRVYKRRYVSNDDRTRVVTVNGVGWGGEPFFCRYKPFAAEPEADIRFCVVRDPVERFQSAFNEIVVRRHFHQPTTVDQFLCQLEATMDEAQKDAREYRVGAGARDMHFRAQHFSLGEDASYFTHIFNLRQLPQLRDLLSELAGEEIPLIHANARKAHEKVEFTTAQRKRVAALYARDYEVFGRWF